MGIYIYSYMGMKIYIYIWEYLWKYVGISMGISMGISGNWLVVQSILKKYKRQLEKDYPI